jgi:hypothetical protein
VKIIAACGLLFGCILLHLGLTMASWEFWALTFLSGIAVGAASQTLKE